MGFEITRVNSLPVWLDGQVARAYQSGCGADQDQAWEAMKAAIKLRWAKRGCIDPGDDEGLAYAGEIRRLDRAPGEDGARYLERLGGAHEIWYWAGTGPGLLQAFEPFFTPIEGGFVGARGETIWLDSVRDADLIARQRGLGRVSPERWIKHYPPSSGLVSALSNYQVDGYWDGNEDWFSRVFFVIDSSDGPWESDGLWDSDASEWEESTDATWDSTATVFDLYFLRTQIRRFKQYSAYPVTIAVRLAELVDGYWSSPGVYDDGGLWEEDATGLYWTVGHVWGEEAWTADGVDTWTEEDDVMTPLDEQERWVDFVTA